MKLQNTDISRKSLRNTNIILAIELCTDVSKFNIIICETHIKRELKTKEKYNISTNCTKPRGHKWS